MRTLVVLMLCAAAACSSNDSVWGPSVTKLVMRRSGGFLPPSQPTADCAIESVEYTLVVDGRTLSARSCSPGSDPSRTLVLTATSRALTSDQFAALVPRLEALHVVSVDSCGFDKPEVTVTITTPSGSSEYGDSFYSCGNDNDTRPTIETTALDAAMTALGGLAFPAP